MYSFSPSVASLRLTATGSPRSSRSNQSMHSRSRAAVGDAGTPDPTAALATALSQMAADVDIGACRSWWTRAGLSRTAAAIYRTDRPAWCAAAMATCRSTSAVSSWSATRQRPSRTPRSLFTLSRDHPEASTVSQVAKRRQLCLENWTPYRRILRRCYSRAKLTDVERELRAQINAVVDVGLAPTHLDWHCLADGGRADILDLALALAKEYGLAARVWLDYGRRKAREQGKPVVDNAFLDSYSISLHDKAATYARMLRDLSPGLNEWAIHPAHGTEQWQMIEPTGWQIRQSDHAFLTSPQAREILDQEGITVIDYRPLQQAWNA